jgi:hypothetical protein
VTEFELPSVEEDETLPAAGLFLQRGKEINVVFAEPVQTSDHPSDPHITRPTSSSGHQRKCSSENGIHYVDDDDGVEFQLDARHLNRVHEELEKLNIATDVINKLELQLGELFLKKCWVVQKITLL